MTNVAYQANYWSSSPYGTSSGSYYLYFYYNGDVNPSSNLYRSPGYPLRCVQE